MLNQLQVQEPDNYEVLTPEGFQALELAPEDTKKLEYAVKAMVGQILAEY